MFTRSSRYHAGLAIGLITSAASLGIAARLFLPGNMGLLLFVGTRIWILALPLLWTLWVDQSQCSVSWPTRSQGLMGLMLGSAMFGIILITYSVGGRHWINLNEVRLRASQVGLLKPIAYLLSAVYFTFINAFLEEYIWRWFVGRQWEVLVNKWSALYLASLCFTLHHVVALAAYTGDGWVVFLGSSGVFVAGAIWSWCYFNYRSLWACYISHVLADLAIALIGWQLLFAHP